MVNFINKNKNISAKALNIIGEEIEKRKSQKILHLKGIIILKRQWLLRIKLI